MFKGAKFHKGLEMIFTNTQAGALALKIGDNEVSSSCTAQEYFHQFQCNFVPKAEKNWPAR
jgi:hypothetical protein